MAIVKSYSPQQEQLRYAELMAQQQQSEMQGRAQIQQAQQQQVRSSFAPACCSAVCMPADGALNAAAYLGGIRLEGAEEALMHDLDGRLVPAKRPSKSKKETRKPFKAESKAQEMLRDLIGFEQWQVYRETNRLAVSGTSLWLIGNLFGSYRKNNPFSSKPDVARIDGKRLLKSGWHATTFCIDPVRTGESLPYTDKVLTFAAACLWDEKGFKKTGNRITEVNFNDLPKSAIFNQPDQEA
ncbi:hypothetical protein LCGC14_0864560 [marine sediment metagenome]|uniref:Uncharacterized protein n=1 Tax=marine sediment metagenome TaxID=412755 RepID=A0A0F9RR21_9ZZZZ